jgi:hypothetical protein
MIVGILALALAGPPQSPPAASPPPAKAEVGIVAALEARHRRCRSLHIEWDEVTIYPRGSFSLVGGPMAIGPAVAPPEEIALPTHHKLTLDCEFWHHTVQGDEYDMASNKIYITHHDSIHKPGLTAFYADYPGAGPSKQSGGYLYGPGARDFGIDLRKSEFGEPVLTIVRPLDPILMLDVPALGQAVPETGTDGGEVCNIFKYRLKDADDCLMEVWASKAGHRIKKILTSGARSFSSSTIIRYSAGGNADPVPIGWEVVIGPKVGPPIKQTKATVTNFEVNPEIRAMDFDFVFPAGIRVTGLKGMGGAKLHPEELTSGPDGILHPVDEKPAPAPR